MRGRRAPSVNDGEISSSCPVDRKREVAPHLKYTLFPLLLPFSVFQYHTRTRTQTHTNLPLFSCSLTLFNTCSVLCAIYTLTQLNLALNQYCRWAHTHTHARTQRPGEGERVCGFVSV